MQTGRVGAWFGRVVMLCGVFAVVVPLADMQAEAPPISLDMTAPPKPKQVEARPPEREPDGRQAILRSLRRERWVVATDRLNVRSGPTRDSKKLGELGAGFEVEVAAIDGDWAEIGYENGQRGWVSTRFLSLAAAH